MDPYAPCPCGSGKKFKWCCQPIHQQINKAFEQDEQGQHETALRLMDEVVAQHPANPEAHGRRAQLLYQLDRADEAEAALDKALELNPNYPFGHYLRGRFRQYEGEMAGALALFRKAADLYHPDARDVLAQIYQSIGLVELRLNRPVAGRAALQIAGRLDAGLEDVRKTLDAVFGPKSFLPMSARREYRFISPPAGAAPERRAAWQQALTTAATGKLTDARKAFEALATADEQDGAAWYNRALTCAWLGDNAAALDALDHYVGLEADEDRAAEAWALSEVLRCGAGLEDLADYVEYSALFHIQDMRPFVEGLTTLADERRFVPTDVPDEGGGPLLGLLLEPGPALTAEQAARQAPRLGAYLLVAGELLHLRHLDRDALDRSMQEVQRRLGPAIGAPDSLRGPAMFADIHSQASVFPLGAKDAEEVRRRVEEGMERYYEGTWLHKPLRSLSGVPPVDAAGHGTLRKKLRGVIQFLQECAETSGQPYDFDRLRRQLGLLRPAAAAAPGPDVGSMGAAELAALSPEALPDDQLEQAYQAALRLDAREIAGRLGKALLARPPQAERPDRFPIYSQLIQQALTQGDTVAALAYVQAGQQADNAHNQGRRQNEYDLRRGQILARQGEVEAAQEVFEGLVGRVPAELRFAASAAEAFLSARQGPRALRFAEAGLAQARRQNNRDSEEHFKELVAAARKQDS